MDKKELIEVFNQQANTYNILWDRLSPISANLYFLLDSILINLPKSSRVLCVGAGTGKELIHLAKKFPTCYFTIVEPSEVMLNICRESVINEGFESQCTFHGNYLESLDKKIKYDVATSFLVSQFILEEKDRIEFFRQIACRLNKDGILVNTDLCYDTNSKEFDKALELWQRIMTGNNTSLDELKAVKKNYEKNVSIVPQKKLFSIINSAGFDETVAFFQASLILGCFSKV